MRRIMTALGALALTTGVLVGTTASAPAPASAQVSAQAETGPAIHCIGYSLLMYASTGLCVYDRYFPVLTHPGS
ncbi:hypothetical protein [Amycolatopsis sp. lyj-23]|uniref:hypothetical protein n=1 Tax=Amycolatopsis sp. lyj-23 TaxID=2789283 RepID=UPI00397E2A56